MDDYKLSNRCICCNGSGTVMGGGMVMSRCGECSGSGKQTVMIDRTSVTYKKAKRDIRKIDANITDAQAEKMLDDEIKKVK